MVEITKDDISAMGVALIYANRSKCVSKHVGAVLTRNGRIVSTGYNGTPMGHLNCNDVYCNGKDSTHREWSLENEVHAEMNAILFAAKDGIKTEGCYLYTTLAPCRECLKAIIQSGISRIYYLYEYKYSPTNWVEYAGKSGIAVIKMSRGDIDG